MENSNKKAPKRFNEAVFGGPDRIDKAMAELQSGLEYFCLVTLPVNFIYV